MKITIHKLNEERIEDYLAFFGKGNQCFCVSWTSNEFNGENFEQIKTRKKYAISAIKNRKLQGYLAYEQGKVIGWCNTNEKNQCVQCEGWRQILTSVHQEHSQKVKSIFCFYVHPEYQKIGVASKLLERIIIDAREEGFDILEAYPDKSFNELYQEFMGPQQLYHNFGFDALYEIDEKIVVRKLL